MRVSLYKEPPTSGPPQFKPELPQGQQYFQRGTQTQTPRLLVVQRPPPREPWANPAGVSLLSQQPPQWDPPFPWPAHCLFSFVLRPSAGKAKYRWKMKRSKPKHAMGTCGLNSFSCQAAVLLGTCQLPYPPCPPNTQTPL